MNRITLMACASILALSVASVFAQTTSTTAEKKPAMPQVSTAQKQTMEHKLQLSKDEVMATQNALARDGFLKSKANGIIDSATMTALREYQKTNKLQETGWPNEETLAKLGVTYKATAMTKQTEGGHHRTNMPIEKKTTEQKHR